MARGEIVLRGRSFLGLVVVGREVMVFPIVVLR